LREAPSAVSNRSAKAKNASKGKSTIRVTRKIKVNKRPGQGSGPKSVKEKEWKEDRDLETEKRMEAAVRAQGRLSKRKGVLKASGTDEFQIASMDALEKLVNGRG
jgi:ATP-dependent RNA helicase DDX31/DBP7